MKRTCFIFIAIIAVYIISSCSKDDVLEGTQLPGVPAMDLLQDCIRLVFCATEENSSLEFMVRTYKEGNIWVNWGEDGLFRPYSEGEVSYQFPAEEKEYWINIYAPDITGIQFSEKGWEQVTSLFFGDCLSLEEFSLPDKRNRIRNLDLTRCPRLKDRFIFHVYDPEFDFSGLRNFRILYYYLHCDLPVVLDDYESTHIHIYPEVDSIPEIAIRNSLSLQNLYIQNGRAPEEKKIRYINQLKLEAGNAGSLGIYNIAIGQPLNLSYLPSLKYLWPQNFDCPETIHFTPSLERVAFNNEEIEYDGRLTSLDLSMCKDLETLYLSGIKSLTKFDIHGLCNLKQVLILNAGPVENQEY